MVRCDEWMLKNADEKRFFFWKNHNFPFDTILGNWMFFSFCSALTFEVCTSCRHSFRARCVKMFLCLFVCVTVYWQLLFCSLSLWKLSCISYNRDVGIQYTVITHTFTETLPCYIVHGFLMIVLNMHSGFLSQSQWVVGWLASLYYT